MLVESNVCDSGLSASQPEPNLSSQLWFQMFSVVYYIAFGEGVRCGSRKYPPVKITEECTLMPRHYHMVIIINS